MKNYAGHRLSPWLGHLMVSRSETARALLTPGEVMQLPPDDEIVMAAGIPPIRARKARYFRDPRFTMRVLEPPKPVHATIAKAAADDWSGLEPIQAEQLLQVPKANGPSTVTETFTPATSRASVKKRSTKSKAENQAETSGIRQEPGLPEHENIAPAPDRPFNPFDPDADISQDETAQNRQAIDRAMRRNARNASLDPNDGIEL
jgi:type IV secretion system protein VirD4